MLWNEADINQRHLFHHLRRKAKDICKIHTLPNLFHFKPMVLGLVLTLPNIQFDLELAPMYYASIAEALQDLNGGLKARCMRGPLRCSDASLRCIAI